MCFLSDYVNVSNIKKIKWQILKIMKRIPRNENYNWKIETEWIWHRSGEIPKTIRIQFREQRIRNNERKAKNHIENRHNLIHI